MRSSLSLSAPTSVPHDRLLRAFLRFVLVLFVFGACTRWPLIVSLIFSSSSVRAGARTHANAIANVHMKSNDRNDGDDDCCDENNVTMSNQSEAFGNNRVRKQ